MIITIIRRDFLFNLARAILPDHTAVVGPLICRRVVDQAVRMDSLVVPMQEVDDLNKWLHYFKIATA